ncbi:MAG: hypothetical protein SGI86_11920 [Deltaproteobacteria bacterium]|nr:hypothetical protein [Deltaproteobacteria bacterium]
MDEAVDLPDGTSVQVSIIDEGDQLDEAESIRLHAALDAAEDEIERGESMLADEYLARIRARRT